MTDASSIKIGIYDQDHLISIVEGPPAEAWSKAKQTVNENALRFRRTQEDEGGSWFKIEDRQGALRHYYKRSGWTAKNLPDTLLETKGKASKKSHAQIKREVDEILMKTR